MIIPLNKSHVGQVTKIHLETLSGDFLPSLGYNFLRILYKGTLGKKNIWGFGFQKDTKSQIDGFVIGTDNINTFFSTAIKSEGLLLSIVLFLKVLTKPHLIKNIISTIFYPRTTESSAELVIICVNKKSQGRGVGKKLVKTFEHQLKKQMIFSYKLTVHQGKRSTHFYEHLRFQKKSSFSLYGKTWVVYHRNLD